MKSKSNQTLLTKLRNQSAFQTISLIINYDFFPKANSLVYCLKQPFGFVVLAILASLLAGLFIGPQGFVLMWAFAALLVVGTAWPWLCLKRVKCSLSFTEQRTFENSETIAQLEVVNRWPFPIYGLLVEGKFLQEVTDPDDLIATGMQKIPGWSVSKFAWHIKPQRRGCMPAEPPQISTGFPFGILKSSHLISVSNQAIVWPKRLPLDGISNLSDRNHSSGGTFTDLPGFDGDTIGVRDYREGDSIRYVHWAKTAQMNRLIMRELQSSVRRTVRIILDLSAETHFGSGPQNSYEMAIRVAGTVYKELQANQISVNLQCVGLSVDQPQKVSTDRGSEAFFDFLAMLPSLEQLSSDDQNVSRLTELSLTTGKREPTILVCTHHSQARKTAGARTQTILIGENQTTEAQDFEADFDSKQQFHRPIRQGAAVTPPFTVVDQPAGRWNTPNFANF